MITIPSHDHSENVTIQQGVQGDCVPLPGHGVSPQISTIPCQRQQGCGGTQSPCRGVGCPHSLSPSRCRRQRRQEKIYYISSLNSIVEFILFSCIMQSICKGMPGERASIQHAAPCRHRRRALQSNSRPFANTHKGLRPYSPMAARKVRS